MRVERLEVHRARFLDARHLGVGRGPGKVDGVGVGGFGVACPAGVHGVPGDVFGQEDVAMAPAANGGQDGACGVGDGAAELAEGFGALFDAWNWHNDGVHHGCLGGDSRRDAGGGAHGDDGGGGGGDGSGSGGGVVSAFQ